MDATDLWRFIGSAPVDTQEELRPVLVAHSLLLGRGWRPHRGCGDEATWGEIWWGSLVAVDGEPTRTVIIETDAYFQAPWFTVTLCSTSGRGSEVRTFSSMDPVVRLLDRLEGLGVDGETSGVWDGVEDEAVEEFPFGDRGDLVASPPRGWWTRLEISGKEFDELPAYSAWVPRPWTGRDTGRRAPRRHPSSLRTFRSSRRRREARVL